ncbi:MAG TPA: aconitate hydratase [Firmicutes bacterium]|nr:aconitate hydratase [Bacillota bacterium]
MTGTITEKILKKHLVSGKLKQGSEIGIKIDQTLTQDATGTMAYLEFLNFKIKSIKTKLSASYIDHNTLQNGFMNADDHLFLQSVAEKYGIYFSKPGNGICHQVHLERFGRPGLTLIGSDSHTPTGGGIGMIAIGVGGLDVACALAGSPFYLSTPEVIGIRLTNRLPEWSCAKDIILFLLKKLSVKGGVGRVFEYFGPGVKSLSVPERATITNMGAELGATTSIFPSDENTKKFFSSFNRLKDFAPLSPDKNAQYDSVIDVDLSKIKPMLAAPHMPDLGVVAAKIKNKKVNQVIIGSCTNSSYRDLMTSAKILKNRKIHKDVSFVVAPGSKTILDAMVQNGHLSYFLKAGARIVESACGPCIGMGQSPSSKAVSVRTFNRNFRGRSGTQDAEIYLAGAETATAAAIFGKITDPAKLGAFPKTEDLKSFPVDDSLLIKPLPAAKRKNTRILMGPNIKPLPESFPLAPSIKAKVISKFGDNITTDDIMPAGAKILPLRSNIPEISKYIFSKTDPEFYDKAKKAGSGVIVGGSNYGQGSSREHAALAPMYLGIKAVITKSFARIHKANLINFGILPLNFRKDSDYSLLKQEDMVELIDVVSALKKHENIKAKYGGRTLYLAYDLSSRDIQILLAGGKINFIKSTLKKQT